MKTPVLLQKSMGFILAFSILVSSCSYRITRQGYPTATDPYAVEDYCEVKLRKGIDTTAAGYRYMGGVSLTDGGFTTKCRESTAHELLREEACKAGANLVHIYEEQYPDLWSSCYRCEASFYYVHPDSIQGPAVSQPLPEGIEAKENTAITILGFIGGFALGYLIVHWAFGGFR